MIHAYCCHRLVYWVSGENLSDKDGNGTDTVNFFGPSKNGILKTEVVSANKKNVQDQIFSAYCTPAHKLRPYLEFETDIVVKSLKKNQIMLDISCESHSKTYFSKNQDTLVFCRFHNIILLDAAVITSAL